MRWCFERVHPIWRCRYVLRQLREVIDGLVRSVDGLVGTRLYLVSVRDIFKIWVILVARRGAQKNNAEEYESRQRRDDLQAAWEEGAWVPVFWHVGGEWHSGRLKDRVAHTNARCSGEDVASRSGMLFKVQKRMTWRARRVQCSKTRVGSGMKHKAHALKLLESKIIDV